MSYLRGARAEALEREREREREIEIQQKPRQVHTTLSQEDIDEIASYDQNEAQYLEALNIDLEEELRLSQRQKKEEADPEGRHILYFRPIIDDNSNKNLTESKPKEEIDLDQTKAYVMKYIARQDIAQGLAAMETDFYDKVGSVTDIMTESALRRLDTFIVERLDIIIYHSKGFSENINIKLTKEESQLYAALSELVSNYRKNICEKLKITE